MRTLLVCFATSLLAVQVARADYILASGGNDTGANGGQSIIRYTDDFQIVWERSPVTGAAEPRVSSVEIGPLNGNVYTSQLNDRIGKHISYADGAYIGRPIPAGGQTDGTGAYTAPNDNMQDIQFGHDYNGDGVADLWVCRRDTIEVYDGTTLNRQGNDGVADILGSVQVADSGGSSGIQDGSGGFGICFGPDITGDGIGELYAIAGVNAGSGSRINVWDPVTLAQVASYVADGTRDNGLIVVGPDVNGDDQQDLWVTDPRNHRIRAYDYATGELVADRISLVSAAAPGTAVTLRFPTDIDYGPDGSFLVTTRFAMSLDLDWTGPSDTAGGDLLRIEWDPTAERGLVTLLFEYNRRLDGVAYVARERKRAVNPYPANSTVDVPFDAILSWQPGQFAGSHDVYFGTSPDDVDAADRGNPLDVLLSRGQDATTFAPDGVIDFGRTYYWRIDEVNAPPSAAIFKGDVWSFTVEPSVYPIENVVATASIPDFEGAVPQNTVNGSGLNSAGQHTNDRADMWLGDNSAGGDAWIQYEFDGAYKLHEMWVWNYNGDLEPFVHFGLKDVTIAYSLDGADWTELGSGHQFAQAPGTAGYEHNTTIAFDGVVAKYVRITVVSNWGTLPQYGLSEVRFYHTPVQAREPSPPNEAANVAVDGVVLNWRPGRDAVSHEVYFNTDRQAVIDESIPADVMIEHRYDLSPLNYGTTYYWKVNEVADATAYPGELWSFTTQEHKSVDDFESYTDDYEAGQAIWQTWIDGLENQTGSIVGYWEAPFAEQTIVHGGKQSMPFEYNNVDPPYYSEAERTWDTPQDWTGNGADTLTLYLRGNPAEFIERPDGSIVIGAGGEDIWGSADQFRFAYKQLAGDGSILARVDSMVPADPWTKVGVMIRESLDAGSKHAAVVVTPGNGVSFVRRPSTGGGSQQANRTGLQAPYWVKLTRIGNQFTAECSEDGLDWASITNDPAASSVDITMAADVFIGLAVTSHSTSMQTSAEFSNVTTAETVAGSWQNAAIGVAQPGNDPAPLYVVVEDKAGHRRLVAHPDPDAVTTMRWLAWPIPFSEFSSAGVNLASVEKMSIGIGDRGNPAPGGTGLLYIDDIGVGHPAAE